MLKKIFIFILTIALPFSILASEAGFARTNIWLSQSSPLIVGDVVKVYSLAVNNDQRNLEGEVIFLKNNLAIGQPIPFKLLGGESSQVFNVNWIAEKGSFTFKAQMRNAYFVDSNGNKTQANNLTSQESNSILVMADSDNDNVGDEAEIENGTDPQNPDTDKDGENDGVDPDPLDSKTFNGSDADKDGISDAVDSDIDNDGLYNWEEEKIGTDPKQYDTDHDGVSDKEDAYPLDPKKQTLPTLPKSFEDNTNISADLNENINQDNSSNKTGNLIENNPIVNQGENIINSEEVINSDLNKNNAPDADNDNQTNKTNVNLNNNLETISQKNSGQVLGEKIYAVDENSVSEILKNIEPISALIFLVALCLSASALFLYLDKK